MIRDLTQENFSYITSKETTFQNIDLLSGNSKKKKNDVAVGN